MRKLLVVAALAITLAGAGPATKPDEPKKPASVSVQQMFDRLPLEAKPKGKAAWSRLEKEVAAQKLDDYADRKLLDHAAFDSAEITGKGDDARLAVTLKEKIHISKNGETVNVVLLVLFKTEIASRIEKLKPGEVVGISGTIKNVDTRNLMYDNSLLLLTIEGPALVESPAKK